jgi:hypothetical protein
VAFLKINFEFFNRQDAKKVMGIEDNNTFGVLGVLAVKYKIIYWK